MTENLDSERQRSREGTEEENKMKRTKSVFVAPKVWLQTWQIPKRERGKLYAGKYLKGNFLGEGTFARVYEAVDIRTLERKAVKKFNFNKIERQRNSQTIKALIRAEADLLISLQHTHIVKVTDVIKENIDIESAHAKKRIYMVMEYMVSSVQEILDVAPGEKLPKGQARRYFRDLIEGLEFLHSKSIVHKDIKPQNLLIASTGQVKIIDLGVCDQIDRYSEKPTVTSTFGTKLFQPPEMYTASDDATFDGFAVDVWACGVTLYRMVSGNFPFGDETQDVLELAENILDNHFGYSPEFISNPALFDVICKLLTKDFNERITIRQIKQHPWVIHQEEEREVAVLIPPSKSGDKYRNMTITPYLHELHSPIDASENYVEVNEDTVDNVKRTLAVPLIRGNRSIRGRPKMSTRSPLSFHERFLGTSGLSYQKE